MNWDTIETKWTEMARRARGDADRSALASPLSGDGDLDKANRDSTVAIVGDLEPLDAPELGIV